MLMMTHSLSTKQGTHGSPGRGGVVGVIRVIFVRAAGLTSKSPYPNIVYSVANYRPHRSHFWANM